MNDSFDNLSDEVNLRYEWKNYVSFFHAVAITIKISNYQT